MPAKGNTKNKQSTIDEAVKRHLAGESVPVLCMYYGISRAGFYLWVRKYKAALMVASRRVGMTTADVAASDKLNLVAELQATQAENRKLRDHIIKMMMLGN